MMYSFAQEITKGLQQLAFPDVCILCRKPLQRLNYHVCKDCLDGPPQLQDEQLVYETNEVLLPSYVLFRWSCWKFEKYGTLQHLMHELKYGGKPRIGIDLGFYAAQSLKILCEQSPGRLNLLSKPLLIPIPLHPRKQRKRGYNQAFYVAQGMANNLDYELPKEEIVQRNKYTRTQTGLNVLERKKNLFEVFSLPYPSKIIGRDVIIIDDVFTTGATTFELAKELMKYSVATISIITLAEA